MLRIGTAGWSIPRSAADVCGGSGTHLERYARCLDCVEINASFYRMPRPATWLKWAASAPGTFRFAVKMPRALTHEARLKCSRQDILAFIEPVQGLGERLGPVLVQLPPSLALEEDVARRFLTMLRECFRGSVVLEPRHATWFGAEADALLNGFQIARVAADPARHRGAELPGGWPGLRYWRLHGSPHTYYSEYGASTLDALTATLRQNSVESWVIFDNTALGHAFHNAQRLQQLTAPVG